VRLWNRVSSRLQLDYDAGEWAVDDAWVQLSLPSGLGLLVGQGKRPFTALSMRSGSQVGTVGRGGSIRGADVVDEQNMVTDLGFADRAPGVQLSGPVPVSVPLRFTAGIFPDEPFESPLALKDAQASVRLTSAVARNLTVGAAWSNRREEGDSVPGRRRSALAADVEWGDDVPGIHLLAEPAAIGGGDGAAPDRGAQALLMYRTKQHGGARLTWEPLLRLSTSAPRDGAGTLVTPGLNLYAGDPDRWNRVMIDYDFWLPSAGGQVARSLKMQLQVGI
jgi:hypothetical protein